MITRHTVVLSAAKHLFLPRHKEPFAALGVTAWRGIAHGHLGQIRYHLRPMELGNLHTLRQRLTKDADLSRVYEYFLDQFAENDGFMKLGHRTSDSVLGSLVEAAGKQLFGPRATFDQSLYVRIAEHHFIHGACRMGSRIASVLYFDDIQTAMVIFAPMGPGDKVQFSRFSARTMPREYFGSSN